jgi:hypothetical protein
MSIETWKAEFYPIPAHETNEADAIDHSLQKWLGLLPENLDKHGVILDSGIVMEQGEPEDGVAIDAGSCSLCHHFCETDTFNSDDDESPCIECPLYKVRGAACDDETDMEWTSNEPAPWHAFTREREGHNPMPMIMWLKKTKENQCQKSA